MLAQRGMKLLGFLVGWMAIWGAAGSGSRLLAGDGPSDKALAKYGLKRSGPVFILESESEVHAKAEEVRHLSRQLREAVARQRSTLSEKDYQATIKQLNDENNQFKAQLNTVNQTLNRLPRRRGYPANSIVAEEQGELNYYKSQLQMEINQHTAALNQLKSRPFDPKARVQADTEVRNRQEAVHAGAQELRKLVDDVNEKYAALAKESRIKQWLDTPEGPAGVKPKLGPSRVFHLDVKMLEQIERAESAGDESSAPARATRKGRRSRTRPAVAKDSADGPF